MKKITYIISNINRAQEFEWVAELLNRDLFELEFVLIDQLEQPEIIQELNRFNRPVVHFRYSSRIEFFKIFFQIIKHLYKSKTTIVHCHLTEATYLGLTAAYVLGIKNRIFTRHHSNFNHIYHPKSVWVDRYCNLLATKIVSITQLVTDILIQKEHVSPNKITLIHHAIDVLRFDQVLPSDILALKEKYNIPQESYVVGVISRYTEWKGVHYIIPAFKAFHTKHPKSHLVLANAKVGEFANQIEALLNELPENSYTEIKFEPNLFALHKLFDVFVHCPIDKESEAFGQIYIEALAAKTPSIFALSGVALEFIENNKNAIVVPNKSTSSILDSLNFLHDTKNKASAIAQKGYYEVLEKFTIQTKIEALQNLYLKL